jgi:pentatricopeptide repeat protein
VYAYNAAISACEKCGKWKRALALLKEMAARGVALNVVSYSAAIETLYAGHQHDDCCRLYREATAGGLFESVRQGNKLDLHGCSAAMACTILSCYLHDVRTTPSLALADLTVVTGKGLGSGEGGPVLVHATRAHLVEIGGPYITEVPENAGRFVLRKEDVAEWIQQQAQELREARHPMEPGFILRVRNAFRRFWQGRP